MMTMVRGIHSSPKLGLAAALCAAGLLLPTPALSTASLGCSGIETDASVDVLFGAGPVPSVLDVTVTSGDLAFSTQNRKGAVPAFIARDFVDDHEIKIDLMDDQAETLLSSIRVLRYDDETTGPFQIGYLVVGEEPPVGIQCDGP